MRNTAAARPYIGSQAPRHGFECFQAALDDHRAAEALRKLLWRQRQHLDGGQVLDARAGGEAWLARSKRRGVMGTDLLALVAAVEPARQPGAGRG